MPLTKQERHVLCHLKSVYPHMSATKITVELNKNRRKKSEFLTPIQVSQCWLRIKNSGSVERKPGSGRPRSGRSAKNISTVRRFIISPSKRPGTHLSPRMIQLRTGIHRSTAQLIIKRDLGIRNFKRVPVHELNGGQRNRRLDRASLLINSRRDVKKLVFSDEKRFTLSRVTHAQNERVYGRRPSLKKETSSDRLKIERGRQSKSVGSSDFSLRIDQFRLNIFTFRSCKQYCKIFQYQ